MNAAFTGLVAYPITPLHDDGSPDLGGVAALVERALTGGADGVTVLATSGAGTSFDLGERADVVRAAVEAAAGRIPVYAGASAASPRAVVPIAAEAARAGAAGLVLSPWAYLPLDDDEVRALFGAVAEAAPALPVCLYNKPVQHGFDVGAELLGRLVAETTVAAVKDPAALPSRPSGRVAELRQAAPGAAIGLSGDLALLESAEPADAWHTGIAGLFPAEYRIVREARVASMARIGTVERISTVERRDGTVASEVAAGAVPAEQTWLVGLVRALQGVGRPLSALHELARLSGVPTAQPRDELVQLTAGDLARIETAYG